MSIEQFDRGQQQAAAAARAGLDTRIGQVPGVDLTQPFARNGRPGTVAQEAFEAVAVVGFDAHRGIDQEAATVFPGDHRLRLWRIQQPTPGHHPQQSPAHGSLDGPERWFMQSGSRVQGEAPGRSGSKHTIDDDAVEMEMGVGRKYLDLAKKTELMTPLAT